MSNVLARNSTDENTPKRVPQIASSSTITRPEIPRSVSDELIVPSSDITAPKTSTGNILQPSQFVNVPAQYQPSGQSVASMISSAGSFSNLNGCTFNFNFGPVGGMLPDTVQPRQNFNFGTVGGLLPENDNASRKRRRVFFISSDESSQE